MTAILVPGANHRLLPGKSRTPLQPRWITVHTMVGTLAGTEAWFRPAGRAYSHFGLGGDGEIRQWQDLRFRAASDLDGNPYSISIECADTGSGFPRWTGSDVPAFTVPQRDALIVLLAWLCRRFGLPATAITTSCPHERGVGWHRLGVDPWRNTACGQRWSSARGKVCPGDRRIHQLRHEIIPAISAPAPAPPAAPAPPPEEEHSMHLPAKIVTSDDPTDPKWWVTDGVVRQHIKNREHAAVLISIGNATAQSGTGDLSKAREIVPYTWPGTVIDSIRPVTAGGSITTAAVTT